MQGPKKIPIIELNRHITCKLCNGYYVDATTIIECLHSFCRSCIVRYLESNKYCPVCDVQVHKTKPLLNIRSDKTLQDIVYKLVPRLFQNEMQRRRDFYESHPEARPSSLEQCGEASYQHLLTPEETVCLTLNYHGANSKPRYLRCPAAVSLGHLKKLIRAKYDLTDNHRVEVLFNQDCLNSSLTLMDVAYIYLWKRKGPIELTYKIYECTAKKLKLEPELEASQTNNNNNWKEVQLRISENGEMSITGIQDGALSPSLLEVVNSDPKYKNEVVTVVEAKSGSKATKKDLPGLKLIGKCANVTSNPSINPAPLNKNSDVEVPAPCTPPVSVSKSEVPTPSFLTSCATLSSGTTTTVFSTINSTKCSTKTDDGPKREESPATVSKEGAAEAILPPKSPPLVNNFADKALKRKNDGVVEAEPPNKQPKPTILNHSIGLLNLSNNHPLKKHSKMNRNGEQVKDVPKNTVLDPELVPTSNVTTSTFKLVSTTPKTSSVSIISDVTFPKPAFVNKNFSGVQVSRPGTPIMTSKPSIMSTKASIIPPRAPASTYTVKSPCYMPKTSYNPVINVPKPVTSAKTEAKPQNVGKNEVKTPAASVATAKSTANACFSAPKLDGKQIVAQQQPAVNLNSKMSIKSKPSTPIGYKTLRDPPKSWNSQISKANLNKPTPDPKYSDLKNIRPAKFFKMRNNMPRYLGNPASGVKPMYQVHVSPEKEKPQEPAKAEKSEIKKHSIVKIDPKTLKPISEKAPETTSLSNHSPVANQSLSNHQSYSHAILTQTNAGQSDLKINTSSVSIFNPLKLQSSPKNERKSPKSPHSPKLRAQSSNSPTGNKREKVNLNFTPPNPFIPNLTSPTLSPNQFLYPSGPPGFPTYDPRMMAAYHSLWYGQRMAFPASPIPGLSLELNQRKNFEMMPSPTSPKMGGMSQQGHSPQISTRTASTSSTNIASISRTRSILPSVSKPPAASKKAPKESKSEKSLENTVEKLTQSRNKEISGKSEASTCGKSTDVRDKEKEKRLKSSESQKEGESAAERVGGDGKKNMDKAANELSSIGAPEDKAKVENEGKQPDDVRTSESVVAVVNMDGNSSVNKLPCIDRGKEANLGTNEVNSKNPSNSSTNNDKISLEAVEGGK